MSGDVVGANFDFNGKADYTLNIINGNPSGNLGWQTDFLFFHFAPVVNAAAIESGFSSQPENVIAQVMGTVGAHELTHRIAGIDDIPYNGGPNGTPNLMQIDSFESQFPTAATNLFLQPYGFLLTTSQVSTLYQKCTKKHPASRRGRGSTGSYPSDPNGGSWVFIDSTGCSGEGCPEGYTGWIWVGGLPGPQRE
jgi:hypothetical protein